MTHSEDPPAPPSAPPEHARDDAGCDELALVRGRAGDDAGRDAPLFAPGREGPGAARPQARVREELLRRRQRRQRVLHRAPRSRFVDLQPWILVLLALAVGFGWLLGRDACSRGIERTYGTLEGSAARDAGPPPRPGLSPRNAGSLPPGARRATTSDDGW